MKTYRKESILAPLFKMLEALFELFVPLVVASIIDVGIAGENQSYIVKMCLLMLGLAVIGLTCSITAQYFAAKSAVGTATKLRYELFSHIQSLGYAEMDTVGTSTLITRMTSDINQVQNGINLVLRLFLRSPFIVFGAMIMAFTIDVKAALIFVVTIPVLSLVVFGVMAITRPMYKNVQKSLDGILGITRENLSGVRVIRAFNRESHELKMFEEANEGLTKLQKVAGWISGLMNPLTFIIINMAIIVLIRVGAIRVNSGSLTQGQVVALYNYMSQILVELIKLANLIVSVTKAIACVNRVNDIFAVEPKMQEGIVGYKGNGNDSVRNESTGNPCAVEFQQVSFQYEGAGDESLTNVSFKVERGQTVGIIGGTGSGKSTLINLIPRFYDATAGNVFLFGRNIKEYTDEAIKKMVCIVPQKAQLFKGTIRENLMLGNAKATKEDLQEALRISQAKEFVDQKDGHLDAIIEQGGKNLSGGQKQRLTIARALTMNSDILIMDDSASALDFATDAKLRKALREMKKSPTVFIVSQRASSIMHADQILVMEDGCVVAAGTHDELLRDCSIYQEIYYSQFKKEA
jgi:ABC-type multidrug transport system fused ATPase/permease subunit